MHPSISTPEHQNTQSLHLLGRLRAHLENAAKWIQSRNILESKIWIVPFEVSVLKVNMFWDKAPKAALQVL